MRFAHPAALWLGLLAIPIVLLHVLRPRREKAVVPSTFLWTKLERPVSAASPWQKLRLSWLLVGQLLAVALLAGAAARPVRLTPARLAQHTVFIVDASGSMAATDGKPTRLEAAVGKARSLRQDLPAGGLASLVVAGPQPEVLLTASPDRAAFNDVIGRIKPSTGSADFAGAFTLAASMETPDAPIGFVLLSDGGLTDVERRLIPAGTRYEKVGQSSTNRAIASLTVSSQGSNLVAHVTARNTGGGAATQDLRIDIDGKTVHTESIHLDEGGAVERDVPIPTGDRVEAFLEGEDLLAGDDHAFAAGSARPPLKVLLAGPDDPFLDGLLAVIPGVAVERAEASRPADGFDVAIYDAVAVPDTPGAPWFAIAAPGGAPGIAVNGAADAPAVTVVRSDDPLLDGIDLSGVGIATAQQLSAPTDTVLVGSDATPLLVGGRRDGQPFAYLGFALSDSNLPVQVAFPVLIDRLLAQLGGTATAARDVRVGDRLPIPVDTAVSVRAPGGTHIDVPAGAAPPITDRPGFWVVQAAGRSERVVAVNTPERESNLRPVDDLPIAPRPVAAGDRTARGERSILAWFALALVAALLAEWFLARRRRGVTRKQWRVATAMRIACLGLVGLAVLAPTLIRRVNDVATVFLVDVSDSLGSGGKADGAAFVRDALAHQRRGSRAGVVAFGGQARLELTVQTQATLSGSPVTADPSRTNLAEALRLGGAVLPSDAKRRIVLVSDGRPTDGDALAEIDRLKTAGIPVDVHLVGRSGGADASVSRVDLPGTVRQGEKYTVRATIVASDDGPATVSLTRDGTVIDDQDVTLVAGQEQVVTFQVVASEPGTNRFQVEVTKAGDTVRQNDVAFGATVVEGAPQVLVVEGAAGNASTLASALRAGGLEVTVVGAADLPGADKLAGYASTVLVDVDVNSLSAAQVQALSSATRDGGRGLVTIGGDHSYALGGYRGSELEALLPVVSEILDPKRRLDVAQVLAIDTSGSMGSCHCAPGSSIDGMIARGNVIGAEGGVNKTDISKAAAARTVEAMSASDEIGVLAFNSEQRWIVPLQKLPAQDVVTKGLRSLTPAGGTDVTQPLEKAAQALRDSKAKLKHIILFTDGFTRIGALDDLATQAKALSDEGITVSVLATGEVAYDELKKVADAGRGRFYAGENLQQVPQIMVQEAMIAARDVVQEGRFLPTVTSNAAVVRSLTSSPPLLGYLATTAKPTATTHLVVGEDRDPLLASWQVGLGRVTSWTADASARWSQQWAQWDGYVGYWSTVVKDTFPVAGAAGSGVRATVVGDRLRISVDSSGGWPAGAVASARVSGPDLVGTEVALTRNADGSFVGEVPADRAGTYTVGASVTAPSGPVLAATTLASQASAPEYRAGNPDRDFLRLLSARTGGRGEIDAKQAFDADGLRSGRAKVTLAGWLLLAAALLWPIAVAVSRLAYRGGAASAGARRSAGAVASAVTSRLRRSMPSRPGGERAPASPADGGRGAPASTNGRASGLAPPTAPSGAAVGTADDDSDTGAGAGAVDTLSQLLERKRAGR